MHKIILTLMAAMVLGCGALSAADAGTAAFKAAFTLKTEWMTEKNIFKNGEKITYKLVVTFPDDYECAGVGGVSGYLIDLPENFCETLKLTPRIHKDPRWSSVILFPLRFNPRGKRDGKEYVCDFTPAGWPEGEYAITINAFFRKRGKNEVKTDVYRQSKLIFTLEK